MRLPASTAVLILFHSVNLASRVASGINNRTVRYDRAFAPFGESYLNFGTTDGYDFTGDTQDTIAGTYDTPNRELNPSQGRWISPDPAGLRAVDPTTSGSLNRYTYVINRPLDNIDPLGLCPPPGVWQDHTRSHGCMNVPAYQHNLATFWMFVGSYLYNGDDDRYTWFYEWQPVGSVLVTSSGPTDNDISFIGGGATSTTCTGTGRGLSGNTALVGKQGGIPGQTVQLNTAAVIPQQFHFATGVALAPFANAISGSIGKASFRSITDVMGGKSPIPGVPVRTALQQLFPGQLILEIPGAADQGANAPVLLSVPYEMECPTGTSRMGGDRSDGGS